MVSKASLADERSGFEFGTIIGIRSGKSGADVPSCCRERMGSRGVLLLSRLTLPPSAGTTVGADEIKERAATENAAVAQHHDASIAAVPAIQRF